MPGMPVAVFGMALSLFVLEANRMSAFQSVGYTPAASRVALLVSVVVLLCLFGLYLSRPTFRLHRYPAIGFVVALAYAGASLCLASNWLWVPLEQLNVITQAVQQAASILLIVCWVEVLASYRAKCVAMAIALSLFVLGGMNMFSFLLKTDAARVLVAVLPFVSIACLYWFKHHSHSLDVVQEPTPMNARTMQTVDSSVAPLEDSAHQTVAFVLSFLLPLLFFSFAFGNVHYSWIPAQDGSFVSISIQLAAGVGTMLGAVVALMFASYFWGRRKIELYLFVALPVLVCALYLTATVDPMHSFAYVVPLNITQKLVLLVTLLTPFLAPRHLPPLAALVLALSSYQIGKLLSGISQDALSSLAYSVCVIVAIMSVLMCITAALLINRTTPSTNSSGSVAGQKGTPSVDPIADAPLANGAADNQDKGGSPHASESRNGVAATGVPAAESSLISSVLSERAHPKVIGIEASTRIPQCQAIPSGSVDFSPIAAEKALESARATEAERRIAACHTIAQEYQLTQREEEVLQLLSEGMNAQTVAEMLVVSTSTAKSHMRNIYAKLDVHVQNELIILVYRHME